MRVVGLVLWTVVLGCTGTSDAPELMEADREFARETAERGAAGWADAFASDGKLFTAGAIIEGRDAIEEAMAVLDEPGYSLTWEPEFAEVSDDLGYTHGTYRREHVDDDGNTVVETGRYVTVWRREANGTWKAVVDIGSASP